MIHASGSNDLQPLYFVTKRDGVDYNLAYIDSDVSAPHVGDFDKAYMNAVFNYAYQRRVTAMRGRRHPRFSRGRSNSPSACSDARGPQGRGCIVVAAIGEKARL